MVLKVLKGTMSMIHFQMVLENFFIYIHIHINREWERWGKYGRKLTIDESG